MGRILKFDFGYRMKPRPLADAVRFAKIVRMRFRALSPIIFVCLTLPGLGCGSKNAGLLEGTRWVSLEATVKGFVQPAGHTVIEFRRDGSFLYQVAGIRHAGQFDLGRGDLVTIKLDKELDGRQLIVARVTVDGDTLTLSDPDGTAVRFRKEPPRSGGTE
jgi:hypothetical protein